MVLLILGFIAWIGFTNFREVGENIGAGAVAATNLGGDPEEVARNEALRNAVVPRDGASYDVGEQWFAFVKTDDVCIDPDNQLGVEVEQTNNYYLIRSIRGTQSVPVYLYYRGEANEKGEVCT